MTMMEVLSDDYFLKDDKRCRNIEQFKKNTGAYVVIELSDQDKDGCQIQYYYQNRLVHPQEIMKLFIQQSFDDKISNPYGHWFPRFMSIYYPTCYLKRFHDDEVLLHNVYGQPVSNIPIAIPTDHLLTGISEMHNLSDQLGGHTPIIIRYQNKEEVLASGRSKKIRKKSFKLVYEFLDNNHLMQEGIAIDHISEEEFYLLAYYLDYLYFLSNNYYVGKQGPMQFPQPYGNILYQKVKQIKKIEQETNRRVEDLSVEG